MEHRNSKNNSCESLNISFDITEQFGENSKWIKKFRDFEIIGNSYNLNGKYLSFETNLIFYSV